MSQLQPCAVHVVSWVKLGHPWPLPEHAAAVKMQPRASQPGLGTVSTHAGSAVQLHIPLLEELDA